MKSLKLFAMITAVALFTFSCKKDDNKKSETEKGISSLVPRGTIVPVAERNAALTGSNDITGARTTATNKWWEIQDGAHMITFNVVCSGIKVPDHEEVEEIDVEDGAYISFAANGDILQSKTSDGANPQKTTTWKWENEKKDAILITGMDEETHESKTIKYTLTWLDGENLVYVYSTNDVSLFSPGCSSGTFNLYFYTKAVK